jgi:glycosyltransferase involved in cell wall biosynthesis
MNEFFSSRVYVGSSISDGVSTSFLEALISGAYPIQTNSSCADEWVAKGCLGTLVGLDSREIFDALKVALSDDEFVDSAAKRNFQIALAELDYEVIRKQALSFYERTSN